MSLLGFAAAGALQGFGAGLVEKAKMEREERMKELDRQHQDARDEKSRQFQASEAAKGRGFQADQQGQRFAHETEQQDTRLKHQEREGDKNRENQRLPGGTYATGDDGTTHMLAGGKSKPVVGEDGQPVKNLRRSTSKDDTVSATTIANAKRDAFKEVKRTLDNGEAKDIGEAIERQREALIGMGVPSNDAQDWAAQARRAYKADEQPKATEKKGSGFFHHLFGGETKKPEAAPSNGSAPASPAPSSGVGTRDNPARPASRADVAKLPSGSFWYAPDGTLKQKP
jgi:hypothetical protein